VPHWALGFKPCNLETTGHIKTFVSLSEYYNSPEFLSRAIEMGDWEIEIQLGERYGRQHRRHPDDSTL
jgi:hypothetical protein